VRGAFAGLGLALPPKRIVANLAPADMPKEGTHYDLPIALAVMAAMGVIPIDALDGWAAMGELSLDGRIVPCAGALPAAMAAGAMDLGLICPEACGPEAAWAGGTRILAPRSLVALINHFRGGQILSAPFARPGGRGRAVPRTCATSRARSTPSGPWRSPPPARTTCCSAVRRARASRCWPSACRGCCRR
jgi:magnesium chelatase family protein